MTGHRPRVRVWHLLWGVYGRRLSRPEGGSPSEDGIWFSPRQADSWGCQPPFPRTLLGSMTADSWGTSSGVTSGQVPFTLGLSFAESSQEEEANGLGPPADPAAQGGSVGIPASHIGASLPMSDPRAFVLTQFCLRFGPSGRGFGGSSAAPILAEVVAPAA